MDRASHSATSEFDTFSPPVKLKPCSVGGADGVVLVSACSGHGAKFAPMIGELAADLANPPPAPRQMAAE